MEKTLKTHIPFLASNRGGIYRNIWDAKLGDLHLVVDAMTQVRVEQAMTETVQALTLCSGGLNFVRGMRDGRIATIRIVGAHEGRISVSIDFFHFNGTWDGSTSSYLPEQINLGTLPTLVATALSKKLEQHLADLDQLIAKV